MNEVLHPEVFARLVELGADVVEVPLLIETCLQSSFRQVWVATCGPAEQRRRLLERHGDEGLVARLLSTQLPSVVKSAFADRTLRTDRPLASVQEEVAVIARELASR
jgi:dephospho-CoA kinase